MSALVLGVGTHPLRVDLTVHGGDPIEQYIPVRGADGVLLDLTSWAVTAQVLTAERQLLASLPIAHDATGLTLLVLGTATAGWVAAGWPTYSPFEIRATHPAGEPLFRTAGWLSLYP